MNKKQAARIAAAYTAGVLFHADGLLETDRVLSRADFDRIDDAFTDLTTRMLKESGLEEFPRSFAEAVSGVLAVEVEGKEQP